MTNSTPTPRIARSQAASARMRREAARSVHTVTRLAYSTKSGDRPKG